ncbi:heavy metal translocating P-type ATPase [Paenibacillus sp. GCM10012307]|uniref:Cd(2+)-exporting ATPase n=1 Tax=Paenibacillus roseus TaxID=2798579 RepID=A0A934J2K4_9BACL|nr:heavy metal translocating P-type ATPase [Paenibacillus roseus]MBJ6363616.1 cadmium-translocating P-type ATPase [Paenibacillus roseus]
MNEYRVKGLSCANCTQTMEQQIRKLEYGDTARLSYNSAKLSLDPQVSLDKVKKILKSDGAYLEELSSSAHNRQELAHGHDSSHKHTHDGHNAHGHDHEHSHSHGAASLMRNLLIVSTVLYGLSFLLDGRIPEIALIAVYLTAIVLSGYKTFIRGLKNLFSFVFTIDTLMTIALIGAVAIGEWKEATLVAILFGLNEMLEDTGMAKVRNSMEKLLQVAPKTATVLDGASEIVVPIESLQAGQLVKVKPGEKIPSDGIVAEGAGSVNEAAITGESLPLHKTSGDQVFGGSVNNEGLLIVQIEKPYKDSSLAKILHLVQEAQDTKTPTELFINRFSKYYTPLIMAMAALVIVIPPLFLGGEWQHWLYQGLAVLIVGCPCALILSSPIAIVAGIARNARNGILVKGGVHLEQLGRINTLAFDKTGTLTQGKPKVQETIVYNEPLFYRVAAAIESSSSHPLAKAIMQEIELKGVVYTQPEEVTAIAGQGVAANVDGVRYWVGNEQIISPTALNDEVLKQAEALKAEGLTIVLAADQEQVLGLFGIADQIREESSAVIDAIKRSGIHQTVILSGDHQITVERVASEVGVTRAYGRMLPEDKAAKIKELSKEGKVAMIGDGINDAPALASADLGIAMGKGSDSAIETADIVLMQDHLGRLPEAISIAKLVNRIIRFNIIVALGLKLIALLLTIPGLLTLWIAILSDMGATVFVTLVSLTVLSNRTARKSRLQTD